MKKILKILIFFFLLWWPVMYALHLPKEEDLGGEFAKADDMTWNWQDWRSEKYQEGKEKYLKENFSGRNTAVRLHNEIEYDLFSSTQVHSTVIGKEGYLYGQDYIDSWFGHNFIGLKKIKVNVEKLKVLHDSLARYHTDLLVVITPGKGSFYPEHFPSYTEGWKRDSNNYDTYRDELKRSGIPFIDLNSYFLGLKDKYPYVLYPKTGIHWSDYAMSMGIDSIVRYIEQLRHIDMPDIRFTGISQTDSVSRVDMDIELGLNLLTPIRKPQMTYPQLDFIEEKKTKPKAIVIGDSFFWATLSSGMAAREFTELEFWFYFYQVNFAYDRKAENTPEDVRSHLLQQDVVILMCNDSKLSNLGWGFIDVAYDQFLEAVRKSAYEEGRIKYFESKMRNDANWLEQVRQKAQKSKVTLDAMIHMDALFLLEQEKKNKDKAGK